MRLTMPVCALVCVAALAIASPVGAQGLGGIVLGAISAAVPPAKSLIDKIWGSTGNPSLKKNDASPKVAAAQSNALTDAASALKPIEATAKELAIVNRMASATSTVEFRLGQMQAALEGDPNGLKPSTWAAVSEAWAQCKDETTDLSSADLFAKLRTIEDTGVRIQLQTSASNLKADVVAVTQRIAAKNGKALSSSCSDFFGHASGTSVAAATYLDILETGIDSLNVWAASHATVNGGNVPGGGFAGGTELRGALMAEPLKLQQANAQRRARMRQTLAAANQMARAASPRVK